jgi:flagellar biosynthesis anti-sigma factor FlgM
MRISLNDATPQVPERGQTNAKNAAKGTGSAPASEQDQTRLSGAHDQVVALAMQAIQLPDAREQRVQSLRQTLVSGNYRPEAGKVAEALFSHMVEAAA